MANIMLQRISALKRLLPIQMKINPNTVMRIEALKEKQLDEAINIFCDASASGDGLSVDEFDKLPSVRHWVQSLPVSAVVDDSTNEMVGVVLNRPSPLKRATEPKGHAGYIAIKPGRWRNVGLGKELMRNIRLMGVSLGYADLLGRTGINSRSVIPMKYSGTRTMGVIPNSINLIGVGWVDDIILYAKYQENDSEISTPPSLPPLIKSDSLFETLQEFSLPRKDHKFPPLVRRYDKVETDSPVSMADNLSLWEVEEMVRHAAERGDGFAVDEFTSKGWLNRRLLWERNVLVVKEPSTGSVIAAVIFGRSAIVRSPNTPQVGGYIIVHPQYQDQGLGSALLEYCLDQAQEVGYKAILTDVFLNNAKGLHLASKFRFAITGTLPDCGHVKGFGLTDGAVLYKLFGSKDWSLPSHL